MGIPNTEGPRREPESQCTCPVGTAPDGVTKIRVADDPACPVAHLSFVGFGPNFLPDPDPDPVNHPPHYGGGDNPYEAIKVIEAWDLGFCLGNAVKYIARAGKKGDAAEDLRKAVWYINRAIAQEEATA